MGVQSGTLARAYDGRDGAAAPGGVVTLLGALLVRPIKGVR